MHLRRVHGSVIRGRHPRGSVRTGHPRPALPIFHTPHCLIWRKDRHQLLPSAAHLRYLSHRCLLRRAAHFRAPFTPSPIVEIRSNGHQSIALELLYSKSFGRISIRSNYRRTNQRKWEKAAPVWHHFRHFGAECLFSSSRSHRTFDRALKELSIGI